MRNLFFPIMFHQRNLLKQMKLQKIMKKNSDFCDFSEAERERERERTFSQFLHASRNT